MRLIEPGRHRGGDGVAGSRELPDLAAVVVGNEEVGRVDEGHAVHVARADGQRGMPAADATRAAGDHLDRLTRRSTRDLEHLRGAVRVARVHEEVVRIGGARGDRANVAEVADGLVGEVARPTDAAGEGYELAARPTLDQAAVDAVGLR